MTRRLAINVTTEQLDDVRAMQRAVLASTRFEAGESFLAWLDRQQAAREAEYLAMLPLVAALLAADDCEREERARSLGMPESAIDKTRELRAANET